MLSSYYSSPPLSTSPPHLPPPPPPPPSSPPLPSPPLQMEIFDAYVEDLIQQEKAKEKAKAGKSTTVVGGGREGERKKGSSELQVD